MKNVKAYAVHSPEKDLEPFRIDRRDPGPGDVEIEILFCGVCHSDIHTVRNEWGGTKYPLVPGHEIVGKVSAVGPGVQRYKIGDTVGVGCFVNSCGECENCNEHQEQYCLKIPTATYNSPSRLEKDRITYGGYATHIVVREDFVLKVSDKLPLHAVAPLLCAGITTYSPLRHWKVREGMKVGVVGLGGLGHMAVKLAASMGAEVSMLSRSPEKEQDAHALGARHFELTTDPVNIKRLSGRFDLIIDTVSAPHDYAPLLSMLGTNGIMVVLGIPPRPSEVPAGQLITRRRSLAGSLVGGIRETQEMLDYCAEKGIVSEVELIPIQRINEAYERTLSADVRYRFVIDMKSLKEASF